MDRKIGNRLEARSWSTPKMGNQALSTDVNYCLPGFPAFPGY